MKETRNNKDDNYQLVRSRILTEFIYSLHSTCNSLPGEVQQFLVGSWQMKVVVPKVPHCRALISGLRGFRTGRFPLTWKPRWKPPGPGPVLLGRIICRHSADAVFARHWRALAIYTIRQRFPCLASCSCARGGPSSDPAGRDRGALGCGGSPPPRTRRTYPRRAGSACSGSNCPIGRPAPWSAASRPSRSGRRPPTRRCPTPGATGGLACR